MPTTRRTPRQGELISLQLEHAAPIRKTEDGIVRRCHKHLRNKIFVSYTRGTFPPATTALRPIFDAGLPFDITGMTHRHHHLLFRNQVGNRKIARILHNLGTPRIGKHLFDEPQLMLDHPHEHLVRSQNGLQTADLCQNLFKFLVNLLLLQTGQTVEPHVQNGLGLLFGELIFPIDKLHQRHRLPLRQGPRQHRLHRTGIPPFRQQRRLGHERVGRLTNPFNNTIDVGQGDRQTLQNVTSSLGLT